MTRKKPAAPKGESLDDLFLSCGMSAAKVAEKTGISRQAIWALRKGAVTARHETLLSLAKALGVDAVRVRDAILASGKGKG